MPRERRQERVRVLEFDLEAFGKAVRRVRYSRLLSMREVVKQTTIPLGTIAHIELGHHVSENSILLAFWADIDIGDYVKVNIISEDIFGRPYKLDKL